MDKSLDFEIPVPYKTVSGGHMNLPCDIQSTIPDDEVYLVLWYKDEIAMPIYSLDARRGKLGQARHASSEELTGRSFFSAKEHPAVLQIDRISLDDEGIYRCRVDFKKARTRHSAILVTVVVPPGVPIVKDINGEVLSGIIGPYNEGEGLHLICETEGGKPSPSLLWYKGPSKVIDDSYEIMSPLIIRNELVISKLQRRDLMATLTCQASNNEISPPVQSSVILDMNFKPVTVSVKGKRKRLSAGKIVQFECEARGSRPPAVITWRKGSQRLKSSVDKMTPQGNVSTSILTLTPTSEDNGKFISCQADNVRIPGSAIEDSWKLEVHYVPQLNLRLGSKLRHSNILEGNDVYFECNIRANPWRVHRSNRGRYSCTATNSEGQGESNHVYLRVQYSPVCKKDQETTYGAMLHYPVQISCEVEADPDDVKFRWEFNSSSGNLELVPTSLFTSGTKSQVHYIPRSESDFGTLLCWGRNSVGQQRVPCLFFVVPAETPHPVHNCTVSEETENSFRLSCMEGKNGGLPQYFFMEIRDMSSNVLQQNVSAQTADFTARGLFAGSTYTVSIFSYNARGKSKPVVIQVSTAASPESQTRQDDMWQLSLNPMLLILCGAVGGLLFVILLIVILIKVHIVRSRKKDIASTAGNEKSIPSSEKSGDNCSEGCNCSGREEEKIRENIPDVVVFSEKMKPGEEEAFATYTAENVHWNRISAAPTEEYLSPQVKMKLQSTKGPWPQQSGDWPPQSMEAVQLQFHRPAEDSSSQDPRVTLPMHTLPTIEENPVVSSATSPPTVIPKQPVIMSARQTDV
ncbi:Nephrin like protein [Argiope bruennichi]|uniref:Nephrin like protein n=1 Tax=Argiope bruennichi TaxID=94029 RepID=A0A8T0EYW7_ARGBR|nr:Nephrin like protein [Argiope bruennichi]